MLEVDITKDGQVNSAGNKDMKRQFRLELDSVLSGNSTMEDFMADWGMTEDEVFNNEWLTYPQEEELNRLQGGMESLDSAEEEIVSEWEPDYSKTAEYEGVGLGSGDPLDLTLDFAQKAGVPEAALLAIGAIKGNKQSIKKIGDKAEGMMSLKGGKLSDIFMKPPVKGPITGIGSATKGGLGNKVFASKSLKANQKAKRGAEGPVVQGASRTLKDSNLRPSIKNKTADRYKSMSDRVKTKRAVELGTAGTAATLIGLSGDDDEIVTGHPPVNDPYEKPKTQSRNLKGNRDEEGNLITASDDDEYDYYGNRRAVTKIMNDPDGFLQRQMNKKSTTGTTQRFTQDDTGRIVVDDEIGFEEPTGPDMVETMGNQFGYHKKEGQNFWTVNNDDPYWDTHVMGTGDAWSDADAKEEVQELDWSSWFK